MTFFARSVPSVPALAESRVKRRLDAWFVMTWPGEGNPVSRQWPLVRTSAGAVSGVAAGLTTEPEQLDSATVPANVAVAAAAGTAPSATVAVTAATSAPIISRGMAGAFDSTEKYVKRC